MSEWSERIKKRRTELGLSQTQLALACGIKPASVNDWESCKTKNIDGLNLVRAARALRTTPEWIMLGRDSMGVEPKPFSDDMDLTGPESQPVELTGAIVLETLMALKRHYANDLGAEYTIKALEADPGEFADTLATRIAAGPIPDTVDLLHAQLMLQNRRGERGDAIRREAGGPPTGGNKEEEGTQAESAEVHRRGGRSKRSNR